MTFYPMFIESSSVAVKDNESKTKTCLFGSIRIKQMPVESEQTLNVSRLLFTKGEC